MGPGEGALLVHSPTFSGNLRCEDSDNDLITVSTDTELADALAQCREGQTLKMTIQPRRDNPVLAGEYTAEESSDVRLTIAAFMQTRESLREGRG